MRILALERSQRRQRSFPFVAWVLLLLATTHRAVLAFNIPVVPPTAGRPRKLQQFQKVGWLVPKNFDSDRRRPVSGIVLDVGTTPPEEKEDTENDEEANPLSTWIAREDDSSTSRPRKRDKLKDWLTKETNMVRPIRTDGSVIEDDSDNPAKMSSLEKFLLGMPSLDEIVGDDEDNNDDAQTSTEDSSTSKKKERDNSWFDEKAKGIEAKYLVIKDEMLEQLEALRREEPEAVPKNARSILETVWRQEMEQEIETERERIANLIIEEYEAEERAYADSRDITGLKDEKVQQLLDDLNAEEDRRAAFQAQADKFASYEQEARRKAAQVKVEQPVAGEDLDEWALKRLEEMLKTKEGNEDALSVTDNLEESVMELEQRIEKEKSKEGKVRPETAKEWQMYQAIANRLSRDKTASGGDDESLDLGNDEDAIAIQLQSWKTFQEKQQSIRNQSGLTRGPKLPFEWQEAERDARLKVEPPSENRGQKRSRAEIREEVNRQALEVMEDLIQRRQGSRSSERLVQGLEDLKTGIQSESYDEDEEEVLEEADTVGPVDVSDVFSSSTVESPVAPPKPRGISEKQSLEATNGSPPPPPDTPFVSSTDQSEPATKAPPPPPDTPFFSDSPPPPPDTAFFSSTEDVDDESLTNVAPDDSKLGTFDDQKLRAMYRRAGAVTEEEQEKIRLQWEEFQRIERQKRDSAGLSDLDGSSAAYNVSDVLTADGDVDAEKILSKIGPRPKRGRPRAQRVTADDASSLSSDVPKEEIVDEMFRAVSATGGGRTKDDPEAKAKDRSAFEKFVLKDLEVREVLDEVETGMTNGTLIPIIDPDTDDEGIDYAESVLDSLEPRPARGKRGRLESLYEQEISAVDEDEELDEDDASDVDDSVPGWIKQEQTSKASRFPSGSGSGFLGSELFDEEEEFEKNKRQLIEYEQRRASKRPKQMGIDISDVLGLDEDDDDYSYSDYSYKGSVGDRDFSSFRARKANLLEYTELEVVELNSVMDHKDSVQVTGVSQYMPRINKPFQEFGAIFRLEGVLVDITGLQHEAWSKVAEKFEVKAPVYEDTRRAAVTASEIAVRRIFCWTDDWAYGLKMAQSHRVELEKVFDKWMDDQGLTYDPNKISDTAALDEDSKASEERDPVLPGSGMSTLETQFAAWIKTADLFDFQMPSEDQIVFASAISAEDAVQKAFRWTTDAKKITSIVAVYKRCLSGDEIDATELSRYISNDAASQSPTRLGTDTGAQGAAQSLSETDVLEIQYKAWTELAKERSLEPPTPDEALGAMVINDPALIIRDGFAWADDPNLVADLVRDYQEKVQHFARERTGSLAQQLPVPDVLPEPEPDPEIISDENAALTKQDLLEMHGYAWTVAAEKHRLGPVPVDVIHLTMHLKPEEATKVLFSQVENEQLLQDAAATFSSELKSVFRKYMLENNLEEDTSIEEITLSSPSKPDPTGPTRDELVKAALDAWTRVAQDRGFICPDEEMVEFCMTVGPEDALPTFNWTKNPFLIKEIVEDYKLRLEEYTSKWESGYKLGSSSDLKKESTETAAPLVSVVPGTTKWLQSLVDVEMQCGVVSHLNRKQLDVLLEYTGLSKFFPGDKRVSSTSGYNRESQQFLGASLRLERRPDHCVVFDTSPQSSVSAHDADMKSVSMIGVYPMYELLTADSTARYCDELTAMNIRRLFGERIYDQPMQESQAERPGTDKSRRTSKTRFWEEGDRGND